MPKATGSTATAVSGTSDECTARLNQGDFCTSKSLPDAPFPICITHAADVMRYINSHLPDEPAAALAADPEPKVEDEDLAQVPITPRGEEVVYYILVGDHIKIGYSTNLIERVRFYPPDAILLATEPGDKKLEKRRLFQFRTTLAYAYEWFRPSVQLVRHINTLRAAPLVPVRLVA